MPRLKATGNKKEARDPIYSQARWGAKRVEPEQVPVRSGGRIKKVKTIFDPSDTANSPKGSSQSQSSLGPPSVSSVNHDAVAEKRVPSRRFSVSTSATTMSAFSNGTPPGSVSGVSVTAVTGAKKRKLEVVPNSRSTSNTIASPKASSQRPAVAPVTATSGSRVVTAHVIPTVSLLKVNAQSSGGGKIVPANKQSQFGTGTVIKTETKSPVHVSPSVHDPPPARRKNLTLQCCECNVFDTLEASQWSKCSSCLVNVHSRCMDLIRPGPYLCRKCTACHACKEPIEGEQEISCCKCHEVFHVDCVFPSAQHLDGGDWECFSCSSKETQRGRKRGNATGEPAEVAAPKTQGQSKGTKGRPKGRNTASSDAPSEIIETSYDPVNGPASVPDASKWSALDVFNFFVDRFPNEAEVLLEQEIDGVSLLLMRRSDVINGLGFKLGPALRIYKQIIMLQTRDTDPTLTWY